MADLTVPVQRIRAFTRDHMLEPDAMRGSEQYLRNIVDGDGNAISPVDEEEARRQFAAEAVQTRAPIRISSSSTQTDASQITAPAVSVAEAPGSSPNVQRAPIGAGTVSPVVTDPGVDWQAKARAEGWSPREDSPREGFTSPFASDRGAPPTTAPVPNANPAPEGAPTYQTAPPPTPASSEGTTETTPTGSGTATLAP